MSRILDFEKNQHFGIKNLKKNAWPKKNNIWKFAHIPKMKLWTKFQLKKPETLPGMILTFGPSQKILTVKLVFNLQIDQK